MFPLTKDQAAGAAPSSRRGGWTLAALTPGGHTAVTGSWGTVWLRTSPTHLILPLGLRTLHWNHPSHAPTEASPPCGAASRTWDGPRDDHEDQQPGFYAEALQSISWSWLGAEAWAGSILPACCSRQGVCLTPPAYARSSQGAGDPPAPCIPCFLTVPACSLYLVPP